MAGLIFGGVDLSGYGFDIIKIKVSAPQMTFTEVPVPGRSGVYRFNPRMTTRQIVAEGIVQGISQSFLMSNVFSLEAQLLGSLNTNPDPTNNTAPTLSLKDLTLPSFGGKKFQNCECETWSWEFLPARILQNVCKFDITFKQIIPFTAPV